MQIWGPGDHYSMISSTKIYMHAIVVKSEK